MIGQCLSNKNESATMSKSKKIGSKQGQIKQLFKIFFLKKLHSTRHPQQAHTFIPINTLT